jgi:hypothetical protein
MRVTIIVDDNFVSVDGVSYNDLDLSVLPQNVHAVQWYGERGEVEFKVDASGHKQHNEVITTLDDFQTVLDVWQTAHDLANAPKPAPTDAELLRDCERTAKGLLEMTDWTQLQDVAGKLANKDAFDAYRSVLRGYAVAPVVSPTWPEQPKPEWV